MQAAKTPKAVEEAREAKSKDKAELAEQSNTALAEQGNTELVKIAPTRAQFEGDFTDDDRAVPYLSIVQKVGKLSEVEAFTFGDYVYGGADGVSLGKEIDVIFCHVRKWFETKVDFDGDDMPETFDRLEDAIAHKRETKEDFRPVAQIDLLISSPALEDNAQIGSWTPARWTVRGTAYAPIVARTLGNDIDGWLKGDLASGIYTLSTKKDSYQTRTWAAPVAKINDRTPDDVRDFIRERTGN